MLIDCSYFAKGSRHIQNATLGKLPNANAVEVVKAIEAYISEYQEEYLVSMLGEVAGNKVHTYLVCLDDDDDPVRNGSMDSLCDRLRESFADYVFFHILRDTSSVSTITGLVRLKCANEYMAPLRRQVNVWNSMVDKNRRIIDWCGSSECHLSGIAVKSEMLTKINQLNL